MNARLRALLALASAALVLIVAPAALAAPKGEGGGAGKLSIRPWPQGYFGFIKTAQPGCMENRRVVVYQRSDERPRSNRDRRLAQGRTELLPSGETGEWGLRAGTSGPAYAVVPRRGRCAEIVSRVLAPQPPRGDVQPCSPDQQPTSGPCRFDRLHLDLYGYSYALAPCPSLTEKFARCSGYPKEGLYPWGGGAVRATEVEWRDESGPRYDNRSMKIWIFKNNTEEKTFSYLNGLVPSPDSPEFRANMVVGPKSSDRSHGSGAFFTPDLPGVGAGEVGGPLYINFENGRWGADIHIWGYLYER